MRKTPPHRLLLRFWSCTRGTSLVEFTLVLPFLLLLGLGMLEFGNGLYGYHVVATGVHDAARYLARLDDPSGSAASGKTLAVTGEVTGTTQRLSWWASGHVTVSFTDISNPIDTATGARTYRGPDPIKIVRVSTTATYPGFGALSYLGITSFTFNVFHEERVISE